MQSLFIKRNLFQGMLNIVTWPSYDSTGNDLIKVTNGSQYIFHLFVFRPVLFTTRRGRRWGLISEYKIDQVDFICDKVFKNGPSKTCGRQPLENLRVIWSAYIGCTFCYLTSLGKLVLIQRSSGQIPIAFNQHNIADKTRVI